MSWQEWRLLLEAARLALFVEIALGVRPLDALLARLDGSTALTIDPERGEWVEAASARLEPRLSLGRSDAGHPSRTACAHAVTLAYRLLPLPRTCLKESLVLFGLLRRRGIDARFRLGVRKEGERLVAHAWIQGKDTPLERTDESYLPLPIPDPNIP